MKSIIPKTPDVPAQLSSETIAFLTEVTFERRVEPKVCDALFVFGANHKYG